MNIDIKDEVAIKQLLAEHINVEDKEIIQIMRLGGLTNKNYRVKTNRGEFVIRLPGDGTEDMINRKDEHICTVLANEIGVDGGLIYFDAETGTKISDYISNAVTMNSKVVRQENNMKSIAGSFKKLHSSGLKTDVRFNVFEKIEEYESVIKGYGGDYLWDDYYDKKREVYQLRDEVKQMNVELTLCHNDPLCENFVKGSDRMYLIDWEYAGMNDPMWDIADFIIEAKLSPDEEEVFCNYYFGGSIDNQMKRRILINKILLDFLWSLWGIQRTANGEDLLDYANERYERAKKNLKLCMEE